MGDTNIRFGFVDNESQFPRLIRFFHIWIFRLSGHDRNFPLAKLFVGTVDGNKECKVGSHVAVLAGFLRLFTHSKFIQISTKKGNDLITSTEEKSDCGGFHIHFQWILKLIAGDFVQARHHRCRKDSQTNEYCFGRYTELCHGEGNSEACWGKYYN
jgi:hypothetical protein